MAGGGRRASCKRCRGRGNRVSGCQGGAWLAGGVEAAERGSGRGRRDAGEPLRGGCRWATEERGWRGSVAGEGAERDSGARARRAPGRREGPPACCSRRRRPDEMDGAAAAALPALGAGSHGGRGHAGGEGESGSSRGAGCVGEGAGFLRGGGGAAIQSGPASACPGPPFVRGGGAPAHVVALWTRLHSGSRSSLAEVQGARGGRAPRGRPAAFRGFDAAASRGAPPPPAGGCPSGSAGGAALSSGGTFTFESRFFFFSAPQNRQRFQVTFVFSTQGGAPFYAGSFVLALE